MRDRCSTLLAVPVGSFDADTWFEADDLIKWWSSQQTTESVHTSFELLDRLVKELKVITPRDDEHEDDVTHDVITYFDARMVVPMMLKSWYEVFKEQASNTNVNSVPGHVDHEKPLELTPGMLLQRMDRYAEEVPWVDAFCASGKAISYFHNATVLKPEPYNESAPFCDYLIGRLWEIIPTKDALSVYMINATLSLWARSGRSDRIKRAETLFTKACDDKVQMDTYTYNTLLSVYASEGLAHKAEKLLQALMQDYLHSGKEHAVAPDAISFHTVALAYANSQRGIEAAQRAEFMVQRLLDPLDDYGSMGIQVTTVLFNTVILAYSRSGVPQAGDEAYRVLREMNSTGLATPDSISYGTVMDAYGRCGKPDVAERVYEDQLAAFRETGDESLRPSALGMTLLVQSYSRSSHPRKIERVKVILNRMFELRSQGILRDDPDTWAYNNVLSCILSTRKSKETAAQAEAFVFSMKERARSGDPEAHPNSWTYCELIVTFLEIGDVSKAEQYVREAYSNPAVELDIRTLARFILAAAKRGWAEKADFWLSHLLDKCEKEAGKPPSIALLGATVSSFYRGIIRQPEGVVKILHLVERYEDLYDAGVSSEAPDGLVYSTAIASLAKTKFPIPDRADKALAILRKLRNATVRHEKGRQMMPTTQTYRDVLRLLVHEGRLYLASEILQQWFEDVRSDPESFPDPDPLCAAYVLGGWAEASSSDAWEKANEIFTQIEDTSGEEYRMGARLLIRDRRCYSSMIELAKKFSLKKEAAALGQALREKESGTTDPPPWRQKKKRNSRKF